jgi:lambda family phage portal protein
MTSHVAADTDDNALRSWTPQPSSPDADLLAERGTIVGRSRDLVRNNGVAQGAQQTIADNVVGTGLRLSPRPQYKLLGRDKAWATEFANTVGGFHRLWWDDTACDAADELNGAGLTTSTIRSLWVDGEACAVPLWLPEPGQLFASRIMLIEPDRLSNPHGLADSATLRAGVERDARTGRPVAYHVRTTHPGDQLAWGLGAAAGLGEWTRIPAKTKWGRRLFLHVHDKDRIGSTRGKPLIAAVMKPFKQLDHYLTVHLQTAIVQSLIAAFIRTPLDQESLVELFGGNADAAQQYFDTKSQRDARTKLKGGALIPLNPGDEVTPFAPPNAANGVDQFVMTVYRQIAAAFNLPYELLLKDFSKTNYSSARAAMLEAWRYFNYLRAKVGFMFCQPAYELVLEEMVDRQMVDAPDFYTLRRAYAASKWIGPGRGWVDPVKEADAAEKRMKSGLSTLEMECAEQGLDWEDVLEQRALEVARCAELGLPNPYAGPPPAAPAEGYPSDELRTPEGDGGGSNEGAAQPDKEQA